MPDLSVKYTIEEYLSKKDLEMVWVMKAISKYF